MKNALWLLAMVLYSIAHGQQDQSSSSKENYFKIGFQTGFGLGFKNIDVIDFVQFNNNNEFVDTGISSISGGGGWHVALLGEYIFNKTYSIGMGFGYQSSHLRPSLENASVRFKRYIFQPTFKYLIGINPQRDQTLNLGIGYGSYTGGTLKFDAAEVGLNGTLDYDNTSGIHLLTEYEYIGPKGFGVLMGLKYYGISYDIKEIIGTFDFDTLKGSGIDLYLGFNYTFR
ncbi:hypothetical protein [Aquimarina mytili]|uniref:Outer membrane protein beta-barrel domain-containing protein n=1 Tax=Aquimarina mytili TaxID=874423 RepID=A0A937A3V5_9FLAO|nr:hypothetical protein [Aquimarina mytili]MBL0683884.1 hypothetical protein [Aquimarina mytili]